MPLGKLAIAAIGATAVGAVTIGVIVTSGSSSGPSPSTTAASKPAPTGEQAAPVTSTTLAPLPLPDPSCQQESQRKSIDGTTVFKLTFVNNTSETLQTFWLNYDGKRVFYRNVPAGTSYVQPTWITHPWIVADKNGTCLTLYVTDGKKDTVAVPVGSVAATPTTGRLAGPDLPGRPIAAVNATDDLTFAPQVVDVRLNDIVEWDNPGTVGHNITFDDPTMAAANDNRLDAGSVWRVKFPERGTFTYVCTLHPDMKGSVSVR